MQRELDLSTHQLTGAFSLALLVSGAATAGYTALLRTMAALAAAAATLAYRAERSLASPPDRTGGCGVMQAWSRRAPSGIWRS
jgi:hypothetical protein